MRVSLVNNQQLFNQMIIKMYYLATSSIQLHHIQLMSYRNKEDFHTYVHHT